MIPTSNTFGGTYRQEHPRAAHRGAGGAVIRSDVLEALEISWSGALVRAGMGYESYSQIADRLEVTARLIMAGRDNLH